MNRFSHDLQGLSIIRSLIFILMLLGSILLIYSMLSPQEVIRVGVLHSLTGTMAISEKPVANATLLAIKELNANGGLLGKKIQPIIVDGQSKDTTFAKEVKRLITEEKVDAIFGCWTSSCRKTIKPIVENYQHIFFYPVQYEGLEQSSNIIYTGAVPNQQIIPALRWSMDNIGQRFFLVSSDYIFPRAANQIIHDVVKKNTAEIVGEEYIPLTPLNDQEQIINIKKMVQKIIKAQPDVIINTINGNSNIHFFEQLFSAGISADKIPVISLSIGESELQYLDKTIMKGHYSVWNYFQTINSEQNSKFIAAYQQEFGHNSVTSDPMESAYFSVYLWAAAVKAAHSSQPISVVEAIKGHGYYAPEGMVTIDKKNLHTWKTVRIAQINKNGQFKIIWDSIHPVKPKPYPASRTKAEWQEYVERLFQQWNSHWVAPQ